MAEKKTKIDIFSGFLGAGKTTLIKKLIKEAFAGEQIVLIENEFGEIGIDGGFMREAGIQVNELNSGCICCSLVGDFREALKKVVETYHPDRILIEPSGVGKLSDVTRAVEGVAEDLPVILNSFVTVADVNKVKMYMKNFGEFYDDQISHASCILLSRTQTASEEKIAAAVAMLREKNPTATIVTTAWDELTGEQILKAMSTKDDFKAELIAMAAKANEKHAEEDEEEEHHHHHHHDDENGVCSCGHHHHDDDDDEDEHEHHHDHDEDDDHDEHEHHHDHDEDHDHEEHCCCGHHHHDDDEDEDEHEHHHEHGGPWLEQLKAYVDGNLALVDRFLKENIPGAKFTIPESTYFAWVDLREVLPEVEDLPDFFANKAGVLLEGGDGLFVGNARGHIRLNLAMPRATVQIGLERIAEAIRKEKAGA